MENSYKNLITRASRGSESAKSEILSRQSSYKDTKLSGLAGEKVVFRYTDFLAESDKFIYKEIRNIGSKLKVKDSIMLDCFSSATIEGARTTVEKVKQVFNAPVSKDDKMVINTIKAQNLVYNSGISDNNIRNIWELIVDGVCENKNVMGDKYRSGDVFVGSLTRIIHTPEKYYNIERRMCELFNYINNSSSSIIKACSVHFYFVYIHPFCDGNGRFARLWMNYILSQISSNFKGVVISREINNDLARYYSSLSESEFSYDGIIDITVFIEYMFNCIINAIEYNKYKKYESLSSIEQRVLDKMKKNSSGITAKKLGSILGISINKSRYLLNGLVNKRYLYVDKSSREYRYFIK